MAEFNCIVEGCVYTEVKNAPVATTGLYICTQHPQVYHLCRPNLERRKCVLDENNTCMLSGRNYRDCELRNPSNFWGHPRKRLSKCEVLQPSVRQSETEQQASLKIVERFSPFPFWTGIKQYLTENRPALPTLVDSSSPLVESMITRSYVLFQLALSADRERPQMNETRRLSECERRYREVSQSILEHLTEDKAIRRDLTTKLGTNRKSGAQFRREIGILLSYDSTKNNDLVPALYQPPPYQRARERWLQQRYQRQDHCSNPSSARTRRSLKSCGRIEKR